MTNILEEIKSKIEPHEQVPIPVTYYYWNFMETTIWENHFDVSIVSLAHNTADYRIFETYKNRF